MKEPTIKFDCYICLDYSENLVGYIIITKEKIPEILMKTTRFHHYKDIKNKKGYIHTIKVVIEKNKLKEDLFKCKIMNLRYNLYLFTDLIEFISKNKECKMFVSIDNNQYNAFIRLVSLASQNQNLVIAKESELKKGSIEYRLSLVIDTLLNIERLEIMNKMSK